MQSKPDNIQEVHCEEILRLLAPEIAGHMFRKFTKAGNNALAEALQTYHYSLNSN